MTEARFKDLREIKEYLKDRVPLADLVARHTKLFKDAKGFKACCPFPDHNEKTPSFNVDVGKNLFYCYGCQRGGDIFSFLEIAEGLPFVDAIKELASEHDLEMPSMKKGSRPSVPSYSKDVFKLIERSAEFYHRYLMDGHGARVDAAQEYLMERGITPEQVELYKLGWAPDAGWELSNKMQGEDRKLAIKGGLLREYNNKTFDFFQDRLMIPIFDHRGRAVAFSGRTLSEVTAKNPKYKNSPESDFFKKKEVLYGIHQCLQLIRSKDYVVVCEGFFDQWALSKLSIPSVAVMGTALTEFHANILKRYCSEIILFMDADNAGVASVMRSLPILLSCELDVKVFVADAGKDPDEWLSSQKSVVKEDIEKRLRSAQEGLEWWGDRILRDGDAQSLNQLQIMKRLVPIWESARSQAHRQVLALRFARAAGMNSREFISSMNSFSRNVNGGRVPSPRVMPRRQQSLQPAITPRDRAAEELLDLWIRAWSVLTPKSHEGWESLENLFEGTIYSSFVGKIASEFALRHGELSGRDLATFVDAENYLEPQKNKLLRSIFESDSSSRAEDSDRLQRSFAELKNFVYELNKKHEIAQLRRKIETLSDASPEAEQLLHRISELLKKDNKRLEI